MTIGEILRDVRTSNNLSLDDIQEKTKIQKRYLMAIESNELDALPGRFYARAFIKEYAEVLELDVAEILRQFDLEHSEPKQSETAQYSRVRRARKMQAGRSSPFLSFLPSLLVILLIIAIIVVGWKLNQKKAEEQQNEPIQEQNEGDDYQQSNGAEGQETNGSTTEDEGKEDEDIEDEEEIDEEPAKVEPHFDVVEAGEGSKPTSTLDFNHEEEQLEITFEASGRTWIDLWQDETTKENHLVGQNLDVDDEPLVFNITDAEKIHLNIGYTPNLQVKINDVLLEYPTDTGTHQKIWIHLNDVAEES